MPTFHALTLLFFLATLSKATSTHNYNQKISTLSYSKTSGGIPRPRNRMPSDFYPDRLEDSSGLSQEWQSAPGKFSDFPDRTYQTNLQLPRPSSKFHHSQRPHPELSNDIDDSFRVYSPLDRYSIISNVIPNRPVSHRPVKDPIYQYMDKLRKVKAIKAALRLYDKKQRAKKIFLKSLDKLRHKESLIHGDKLKEVPQPKKYRRAKLFAHKDSINEKFGKSNLKPSTSLVSRPFDPKPQSSFPDGGFGDIQAINPSSNVAFPPQEMNNDFNAFRYNTKPSSYINDVSFSHSSPKFAQSQWSSIEPLKSSSLSSKSSLDASFSPSLDSQNFDFPDAESSDSLSWSEPLIDSQGAFFDVQNSKHGSSIPESSNSDSFGFTGDFQSFPLPSKPGATENLPMKSQDGFSSDGFWGADAFASDKNDCNTIDTKSCLTDLDCGCYGFYTCSQGKCTSKPWGTGTGTGTGGSSKGQLMEVWHDEPVDFGFSKRDLFSGLFRNTRSIRYKRLVRERLQKGS